MRIDITKDWCNRMAQLEADSEIGAGLVAIDPVFDGEAATAFGPVDETNIAFGRFVRLMRRARRLTLEKLAEEADVDVVELVAIEDDSHHKPEVRTVYQLANYFRLPRANLLQVAGLTAPKDQGLVAEAVRFAARSDPLAELAPQEREALEAFVAVLSEQK